MLNTEQEFIPNPEIVVYATNKNFFNFIDALVKLGKVELQLAQYGDTYTMAHCYLDRQALRSALTAITSGMFTTLFPGGWEEFGGSTKADGVESRSFRLVYDEAGGSFAKYPWQVTVSNGPGTVGKTGAIMPKGAATAKVVMRLPSTAMYEIATTTLAYLLADEIHHLEERQVASVNKQMEKRKSK